MAIIYVNLSATGDGRGSSWENAFTNLQSAIDAATAGADQIWVAAGTYTPGTNRTNTFTINKAIEIYGGFVGTESSLDQRNYETNQTILSGDIGTLEDSSDNSYHVVTTSSTVVLDGVIIQGGNTTGDSTNPDGGGIYNTGAGSLTLRNAIVQGNLSADDGGGIRNDGSLTIYNSTIQNNTATGTSTTSGGGGLINTSNATATVINSLFTGNTGDNGGAIRNDGTLNLVNSTLSGNTATETGGGLSNSADSTNFRMFSLLGVAKIINSTITNNIAQGQSDSNGVAAAGIANFSTLYIGNSIVAGNANNGDFVDLLAGLLGSSYSSTSLGNNLIGNGSGVSGFTDGTNGDQVGSISSPLPSGLEALTDNGGFVQTHALTSTSAALDAGSGAIAISLDEAVLKVDLNNDTDIADTFATVGELAFDQRGANYSRVQDNPNNFDGTQTVDIGAFELQECFLAGTLIRTEFGEKPVEELERGDRLLTASGQLEPVKWIGRQTYHRHTAHPFRSNPIQIKPGALGNNLPLRDLYVSPDHALLVDGLLINAGALTNGISIVQIQPQEDRFTYYHVELEHHALLLAEGSAAESYLPQKQDRDTFDNGAEYAALYPHQSLLSLLPMNYPRVSSKRQMPRYVAERLEKLGRSLYPHVKAEQCA